MAGPVLFDRHQGFRNPLKLINYFEIIPKFVGSTYNLLNLIFTIDIL